MADVEIPIAEPIDHQLAAYLSPKRFKLLHPGRRWGKDRLALPAAITGHGPGWPDAPLFEGVIHGWWVLWVVRDFTQGMGVWREEILPRFAPARPIIKVNQNDLRVEFPGGGGFFLCTAENLHSIRGLGKRIKGVVVNEAAFLDLERAWKSVLRAILVDNQGWAILMSSPNSGLDGNPEGISPSYFNRLCHQVYGGGLGEEWGVWGGDLRDNPTIDPAEALAFLRELGDGTRQQAEEGYGKLIQAGAGLAFPIWAPTIHLRPWFTPAAEEIVVLGMDWGIRADSVVVACTITSQRTLTAIREWSWQDKDAYDAGYDFALGLLTLDCRWPEWLVVDSAMNERTGVGGTTILQEFQAGVDAALAPVKAPSLPIIPAPKGPGSRAGMYNQITKVLRWGPPLADGSVPASRMPLFRVMQGADGMPTCPKLTRDLATAVLHSKHQDEVDKDKSPFHAGEALGYLLSLALPKADKATAELPQDRHPGWVVPGVKRSRERSPEVERQERAIQRDYLARQGKGSSGRYGRNPRG